MARIPTAQGLGDVIAQPGPAVMTSPNAQGAGLAQGLFRVGATLQQVAGQEARQAAALRESADRAAAVDALTYTRDDLATLRDDFTEGVRTGARDKREAGAEWERMTAERISAALEGVPQAHRGAVQRGLDHEARKLRRDVARAVMKRDQSDVGAGIDSTMERAQRLYRTDPIAAEELVAGSLVELGPAAGLTPEQIGQRRQAWREGAQYTTAYEAVSAGRADEQALGAAEQTLARMDALDPQKKAQLQDRITLYRAGIESRRAAAEQRARGEEERKLRIAEHSFNAFQSLADKGTALDPTYIDSTLKAVAGTPYEAAVRGLAKQAAETGGLAARSPAELQAAIQALDTQIAQSGRTPELDKRRDQVEKVLTAMNNDMAADPLPAALQRGWITNIAPVDVSSPQAMARSIGERLNQTTMVMTKLGRPVSPLREQEATTVKQGLDLLPVKERAAAVGVLAQTLGPQFSAGLAAQMDKQDRALALAFGLAGSKTSAGRNVSELVLGGAQAMKDGTSTKNEKQAAVKPQEWKRVIATEVAGLYPSDRQRADTGDAALYVAHGIAAEQGGALDDNDLERAVRLAVGGPVIDHNGRRIPLVNTTEEALSNRLRTITSADLQLPDKVVRAGGVAVAADEFVKALPGQQLMYAGPGRYAVIVQGRPVTTSRGAPVIISVPQ